MQQRIKSIITSSHPPLRTIQVTNNELIILAALQHYPHCTCHQENLAEAIPITQGFIERLHRQSPSRQDRIAGHESEGETLT